MKNKKVRFQDSEFYFCDCPICQAMKKAEDENKELSLIELLAVFDRANNDRKI